MTAITKDELKPGQKICRRCRGKGFGSWVVQMGMCFGCFGRGWTWIDPFREHFSRDADGQFFGTTFASPCGDDVRIVKSLTPLRALTSDGVPGDVAASGVVWTNDAVFVAITNEQARAFFAAHTHRMDFVTLAGFRNDYLPRYFAALRARAPFSLIRDVIAHHPHVVRLP